MTHKRIMVVRIPGSDAKKGRSNGRKEGMMDVKEEGDKMYKRNKERK